jgi:hypothetical protein
MPPALVRSRRFRALILALSVAFALAGAFQPRSAEAAPRYLLCELKDGSLLYIVVANFGGMGGAVRHCIHFWGGRPRGVEN